MRIFRRRVGSVTLGVAAVLAGVAMPAQAGTADAGTAAVRRAARDCPKPGSDAPGDTSCPDKPARAAVVANDPVVRADTTATAGTATPAGTSAAPAGSVGGTAPAVPAVAPDPVCGSRPDRVPAVYGVDAGPAAPGFPERGGLQDRYHVVRDAQLAGIAGYLLGSEVSAQSPVNFGVLPPLIP